MDTLADICQFLKKREGFHRAQARRKLNRDPKSSGKHSSTADTHAAIITFLENLNEDAITASQHNDQSPTEDLFSISEADLTNLPETVLKSLNLSEGEILESQIVELIKIAKRPLSVKELIVGLYKKYRYEVPNRNQFASKLYRMSNSGILSPVEGKKGYYDVG